MAKAPGTIRKRGTGWQVILRVNGGRFQYGPRTEPFLGVAKSKKQVEEWVWRKYRELEEAARQEAMGLQADVSFSEVLRKFRDEELPKRAPGTQAAYLDTIKPLEEFFVRGELRDPPVAQIQSGHIERYLSWRRVHRRNGKAPLSNRTLNKDRAVLHRIFVKTDKWGYREGNPVARVDPETVDKHDPVILKDHEYERLLKECREYGPMLYLYTLLLGEAGVRAYSEALRLTWKDVDLEEGFLYLASRRKHQGKREARLKGGKGRWVPMTPRLRAAMRDHFAEYRFARYDGKPTRWVFHHVASREPHYKAGDRLKDLRASFDSAARRAKLDEGFRRHDLRHRRVTTWLAEGKPAPIVQEAMGHSDLKTTMGYKHLAKKHLKVLVDEEDGAEGKEDVG